MLETSGAGTTVLVRGSAQQSPQVLQKGWSPEISTVWSRGNCRWQAQDKDRGQKLFLLDCHCEVNSPCHLSLLQQESQGTDFSSKADHLANPNKHPTTPQVNPTRQWAGHKAQNSKAQSQKAEKPQTPRVQSSLPAFLF